MPWVPSNDFEEEVVNLQPHHDFIYGTLSESEYSYPRPQAHMEYAANKKIQQKNYGTSSQINAQLRTLQQVQLIAGTKPLGEQPSLEDWDNDENIEQETIGMMRHCGMGVSVEQPLDQKVTIASNPVDNTIKLVRNGRRKVALFFDDNVFKFQEKVSDTSSSEYESFRNTESNEVNKNDSLVSELDEDGDTSFNTSSSLPLKSFSASECSDSFSSAASFSIKMPSTHKNERRSHQYEKLLEDTALLSLDSCSSGNNKSSRNKKAEETSVWKPILEDEDLFSKEDNWPSLSKKNSSSYKNDSADNSVCNKTQNDSSSEISSEASGGGKRKSFLERFIKPEYEDDEISVNTIATSTSTASSKDSSTYAAIAKAPKIQPQTTLKKKEKKDASLNRINDFPLFYSTRRMYALKRSAK